LSQLAAQNEGGSKDRIIEAEKLVNFVSPPCFWCASLIFCPPSYFVSGCCRSLIVSCECVVYLQLLAELDWNALSATTLHFSQCFISLGVHCNGDTLDVLPINARDKDVVHKHMESFATFILPGLLSQHLIYSHSHFHKQRSSKCVKRARGGEGL